MRSILPAFSLLTLAVPLAAQDFFDTGNRWQTRDYYNAAFIGLEKPDIGWTGSFASTEPGTVSDAWQEAVLQYVQYFRAMAGVPYTHISLNDEWSAMAQQAALMMGIENRISHTPKAEKEQNPALWPYLTDDGDEAAGRSNLAWGINGTDAVVGYVSDHGLGNEGVGHRRWLLLPQVNQIGNGDVPERAAPQQEKINVLWVIPDDECLWMIAPTREEFVAWPPAGYVPAPLAYARWSLSIYGADFSDATVTMLVNGESHPLTLEPIDSRSIGQPTLVWVPDGLDPVTGTAWPMPAEDLPIHVTVSGIRIDGSEPVHSVDYTVTLFDPSQRGPEEVPTSLHHGNQPGNFTASTRAWSEAVQLRMFAGTPVNTVFDAESDTLPFNANITAGNSPFNDGRRASGNHAFGLYHKDVQNLDDQILQFPNELLVSEPTASIDLMSSVGLATDQQIASIEVRDSSTGLWYALWEKAGDNSVNLGFEAVSVPLAAFHERFISIRLRWRAEPRNNAVEIFPGTDPQYGWAFDDVELSGVTVLDALPLEQDTFAGPPIEVAVPDLPYVYLQARELAFGGLPLEWGPVLAVGSSAGLPSLVTVPGQWAYDPVVGMNFADPQSAYLYTLSMNWIEVSNFPWIHTSQGWLTYLHGNLRDGLWLYQPPRGFAYTDEGMQGALIWPFDPEQQTSFFP
jgi:hypothetical protein